ncbi:unnamed protein product [Parnassius mnemosyne]|uniref:Larval cuticle protein 1 n=1 Tax=Parnassius mnemosyne TaxID=213953 RepID=A0AAV1MCV7_9NEOP
MIAVTLALVAAASAVPVTDVKPEVGLRTYVEPVKTIRSESSQQPEGPYSFSFETENGITREENGQVKEVLDEENKPQTVVVVRGAYSYTDNDGKIETINYYADETGFHAEGPSIPTVAPSRR